MLTGYLTNSNHQDSDQISRVTVVSTEPLGYNIKVTNMLLITLFMSILITGTHIKFHNTD